MKRPLHILFISHDATRTGAPLLLLHLATLLKQHGHQVEFLSKWGGELLNDFAAIGKTSTYYMPRKLKLMDKMRKKLLRKKSYSLNIFDWDKIDFVLSNTITNGEVLADIRSYFKGPIVSYVHELKMITDACCTPEQLETTLNESKLILTPSNVVADFLHKEHNVSCKKIKWLPYLIQNLPPVSSNNTKSYFTVGGAGTVEWRKGVDLFVQVAKKFKELRPEAHCRFLWKGFTPSKEDLLRLQFDVEKADMQSVVHFLPPSSDMASFFNGIDVLALTSREDAYPLVMLEAASASVPTVCFEGGGGGPEFVVKSSGGRTAPYLDIQAIAEAIAFYYDNDDERKKDGLLAQKFVLETHRNPDYVYQCFEAIADEVLG